MGIFDGKKRIDDPDFKNQELINAVDALRVSFVDLDYMVRHLNLCNTEDKEVQAERTIGMIRARLRDVVAEIDRVASAVPNVACKKDPTDDRCCFVCKTKLTEKISHWRQNILPSKFLSEYSKPLADVFCGGVYTTEYPEEPNFWALACDKHRSALTKLADVIHHCGSKINRQYLIEAYLLAKEYAFAKNEAQKEIAWRKVFPVERTASEIRNSIIFCNELENGIGPGHKEYNGFMWDYRRANITKTALAKFNDQNILLNLVSDKRTHRVWLMTEDEYDKL